MAGLQTDNQAIKLNAQSLPIIQGYLKELDLYDFKVDGLYGKRTKAGLEEFATENGLKDAFDGETLTVTSEFVTKLKEAAGEKAAEREAAQQEKVNAAKDNDQASRELQDLLKEKGFKIGKTDGIVGRKTGCAANALLDQLEEKDIDVAAARKDIKDNTAITPETLELIKKNIGKLDQGDVSVAIEKYNQECAKTAAKAAVEPKKRRGSGGSERRSGGDGRDQRECDLIASMSVDERIDYYRDTGAGGSLNYQFLRYAAMREATSGDLRQIAANARSEGIVPASLYSLKQAPYGTPENDRPVWVANTDNITDKSPGDVIGVQHNLPGAKKRDGGCGIVGGRAKPTKLWPTPFGGGGLASPSAPSGPSGGEGPGGGEGAGCE